MATRSRVTVVYDRFPALRADLLPRADAIVGATALEIERDAKGRAPVDTGTLRRSIHTVAPRRGVREVGTNLGYAWFVEAGTHRMAARPYLTPAAEAARPRFVEAMKKLLA